MLNKAATVRKFLQAGKQRLTTAGFLLRHGEGCYIDSEYLAGYGVECALKALILARTPRPLFDAMLQRLTSGQKAHNYEMLKNILKSAPIHQTIPVVVAPSFRRVGTWTTDLRYEVGTGDSEAAASFFEAAQEIVRWVESAL